MRTHATSGLKWLEAIATTGTLARTNSSTAALDSHKGGGRITPATPLASLRAALRSASASRSSQQSITSWIDVRDATRNTPSSNSRK